MLFQEKLNSIQSDLIKSGIDGWLLYDFRRSNPLACELLEIPTDQLLTRRFFYWIPAKGSPVKFSHRIESQILEHLPGESRHYHTWQEIDTFMAAILKGCRCIAMEYSPRNAIPYISKVDAGTVDLVRELGVTVVSSANLLQAYLSAWDNDQLHSHLTAAAVLCATVNKTWKWIADTLSDHKSPSEYDVQQFILEEFTKAGCVTSDSPICAINEHSANPHYCATKEKTSKIKAGDFILIDLWCKEHKSRAVYADITRVGVAAEAPLEYHNEIFSIVKKARDKATELVRERFRQKIPVMGYEVDQCCRDVIRGAGYGEYFIHRTGHSIGENDHGNGANVDNLETQDSRLLLPGTCFSIEPGIYLPNKFGVRLEYDVYIHNDGQVQVTGGIQEAITCLF